MQKFEALLFDLDGTVVDNMDYHIKAWVQYLKMHGVNDDEKVVYKKVAGKTTEEVIHDYFGDNLSEQEVQNHYRTKETLYKEIYLPHMKEVPGISALLKQAKDLGLPMAVASAAGIDNIEYVINNLNIAHYFKAIVCAQDVAHGKPDPEIFLLAAKRLGVDPAKCLVFEDSLVGVEGAQNAGMKAIAITTGHPAEKFAGYASVIRVVDNFVGLDLTTLSN